MVKEYKKQIFEEYKKIIYFFYEIFYAIGNALISAFWGLIPYFVLKSYGLNLGSKYYGLVLIFATLGNYWYNYKKITSN